MEEINSKIKETVETGVIEMTSKEEEQKETEEPKAIMETSEVIDMASKEEEQKEEIQDPKPKMNETSEEVIDMTSKEEEQKEEEIEEPKPKKKSGKRKQKEDTENKESKEPKLKRPLSSFFLFSKDKRPEIKVTNPEFTAIEVSKEASRLWKLLSDEDKQKYKEIYTENLKIFKAKQEEEKAKQSN